MDKEQTKTTSQFPQKGKAGFLHTIHFITAIGRERNTCKMNISRNTLNEIFRFGITGGLATLLQFAIYWLLQPYIGRNIALPISYFLSFVFNYFMSARFTFRKKTSGRNGIGFAMAHAVNFLLQLGLLNLFAWLGVQERLALIPTFCITIPVNFTLVRFVFKKA